MMARAPKGQTLEEPSGVLGFGFTHGTSVWNAISRFPLARMNGNIITYIAEKVLSRCWL